MITLRKAGERGHADFGWLDSYHTFSFGNYYDPAQQGHGDLRVINEDRVRAGEGFPPHAHRDMEILSYVLDGALEHKDSMGTGSVIRPGDVQRMSAGSGVTHSEYNASPREPVHFLQIWIVPRERGIRPGYEQKHFSDEEKRGRLRLIASEDGREGSVTLHQDARVYAAVLAEGQELVHRFEGRRKGWVQVARGVVRVGGVALQSGDGAALSDEAQVTIVGGGPSEILLFDLAGAR